MTPIIERVRYGKTKVPLIRPPPKVERGGIGSQYGRKEERDVAILQNYRAANFSQVAEYLFLTGQVQDSDEALAPVVSRWWEAVADAVTLRGLFFESTTGYRILCTSDQPGPFDQYFEVVRPGAGVRDKCVWVEESEAQLRKRSVPMCTHIFCEADGMPVIITPAMRVIKGIAGPLPPDDVYQRMYPMAYVATRPEDAAKTLPAALRLTRLLRYNQLLHK